MIVWPYLVVAWRMPGDPRWEWLEGDERLVGIYDLGDELPRSSRSPSGFGRFISPPTSRSNNRCAAARRPTGRLFSRIEPEIRALRRAIFGAVERHIAQLPPRIPAIRCSSAARAGALRGFLVGAGWPAKAIHSNHIHPAGLVQLGLLRRAARKHRRACRLARAGRAAEPSSASICRRLPPDRAEARAAGPVPLDHVARDEPVRGGRAVDSRLRRRASALRPPWRSLRQPRSRSHPLSPRRPRRRARGRRGGACGGPGNVELSAFAGLVAAQAGDPAARCPISAGYRAPRPTTFPRSSISRSPCLPPADSTKRARVCAAGGEDPRLLRIAAYVHQQQGRLAEAAAAYEAVISGPRRLGEPQQSRQRARGVGRSRCRGRRLPRGDRAQARHGRNRHQPVGRARSGRAAGRTARR